MKQVEGDDSAPLLCSCETPLEVLGPVLEPPTQEGHGAAGVGQEEGHEDALGLVSLEKRRLQGDLIAAFQYLKGPNRKAGEGIFIRVCSGSGFKLEEGRFSLDNRKKFLTERVVRRWNRLPREVVGATSLEAFKASLDGAFSNLV